MFENLTFNSINFPYKHIVFDLPLSPDQLNDLTSWLNSGAPWEFQDDSFYRLYSFKHTLGAPYPNQLDFLLNPETLEALSTKLSSTLATSSFDEIEVEGLKLLPDSNIPIHNDMLARENRILAARLILYINRDWDYEHHGGQFAMFNTSTPTGTDKDTKIYSPQCGSCIAFEVSNESYHAVLPVKSNTRYTLSYSFYRTQK